MAATGTPTPNIGLRIPIGTDPASVDDINYNSNLIDTKLGPVGSDSVQDQIDNLNNNMMQKSSFIIQNNLVATGNASGYVTDIRNIFPISYPPGKYLGMIFRLNNGTSASILLYSTYEAAIESGFTVSTDETFALFAIRVD